MKSFMRLIGRLAFFPVILGVGCAIGAIAVATHPRQVLNRLRAKGCGVFESFSPEERKVLLHIALGFFVAAVLIVAIVVACRMQGPG